MKQLILTLMFTHQHHPDVSFISHVSNGDLICLVLCGEGWRLWAVQANKTETSDKDLRQIKNQCDIRVMSELLPQLFFAFTRRVLSLLVRMAEV